MKTTPFLVAVLSLTLLFAWDVNHAQESILKEVSICSGEKCEAAEKIYSADQLLNEFQQLLTSNESEKVPMCNADPKTHECKSEKVCHFVLGGIIPGNGCSQSLTFSEVTKNEPNMQLAMKTNMPLTFIGTPLKCVIALGIISVRSVNDISLQLKPHFCSWMAVGAMTAQLNFKIDFINLDRGEIGGYWQHSVRGTGNGSGSGYLVLKFPKTLSPQTMGAKTVEINKSAIAISDK